MKVGRRVPGLALALVLVAACSSGGPVPSANAPSADGGASSTSGTEASTAAATVPAGGGGGGAVGGVVAAGDDLCGLLGPGDFAAVGLTAAGKPKENNQDANDVYCVYAGDSAGTGGIEFDAFLAGSTADSQASFESVSEGMVDPNGIAKAAFPDADGAVLDPDTPDGYAGIGIWQGKLVFAIGIPSTDQAKDQLIALSKLVLQRAAALT